MRARGPTPALKPGKKPRRPAVRRPPAKASEPPPARAEKPAVRIFVSYSHRDADARARLETHLAPLKRDGVETWFDGDMDAGDKLDAGIARELRKAHVFVGLLSPDYLASNYCWKVEYRRAMNRRARGTMRVVAVVVRPCDWKSTPAAGFKLLPEDGREVTRWRSADAAYLDVAQGIRRVVASVRKDMSTAPAKAATKKRPPPSKVIAEPSAKRAPRATKKPTVTRGAARKPSPKTGAGRGKAQSHRTPLPKDVGADARPPSRPKRRKASSRRPRPAERSG